MTEQEQKEPQAQALPALRRLAALAQSGLAYTDNPYDVVRYQEIQQLCTSLMATPGAIDRATLDGAFQAQVGYATPKLDVRAAMFVGERIVLVQERADHDRWTLPGGWADVGYSPTEAVLKEVQEECGLRARVRKLVALLDHHRPPNPAQSPFAIWKMLFLCEIVDGEFAPSLEVSGMDTFAEGEWPSELSRSRTTPEHLRLAFAHRRQPELAPRID